MRNETEKLRSIAEQHIRHLYTLHGVDIFKARWQILFQLLLHCSSQSATVKTVKELLKSVKVCQS